jgi:hypothetical protein
LLLRRLSLFSVVLASVACSDARGLASPTELSAPGFSPSDPMEDAAPVALSEPREIRPAPVEEAPLPTVRPRELAQRARVNVNGELQLLPVSSVSLSAVRTVEVQVQIAGIAAGTEMVVEFRSPEGLPFERRTVTIQSAEEQILTFELPVAGTLIDTAHLAGRWSARVFTGGVQRSSIPFEILP